ncbi:hypothetical protein C4D60_Mb08t02430 [Musa balbisiana]|uniref:Protein kinase domain-containing protein n=1 Tax=Musa balbisiana TaxID=52838 RepID=A0A4S8K0W6_MUSBA|nr:hypothetical protein C4D60_Mb08t02430 [Musa balbisiana]
MSCFPCFSKKNIPKEDLLPPVSGVVKEHEPNGKPESHPTQKTSDEATQRDAGTANIAAQTFTFRELASATKNFRAEFLLGEGGFGRVYKGIPADQKPLSWYTRMRIAYGAAQGLEYLHEKANPPVIYRDLKSSNILLDEEFNAKLSDSGFARLGPMGDKGHVSAMVMGTDGYCAPECARTDQLTMKSDVYRDYPAKGLSQAVAVAAICLQEEASVRPLMADVVKALSFLTTAADSLPQDSVLEDEYEQSDENSD